MPKHIVLCADDYGQAPSISQSIIDLAQRKRISAVSCLVNMDNWLEHARLIVPLKDQIDIGLHFNLTEGRAVSKAYVKAYGANLMPLKTLLIKSLTKNLDVEVINAELNAQIERFVEGTFFLPHFIDGHQHVHQFPIIREAVLKLFTNNLNSTAFFDLQSTYVRLVLAKYNLLNVMDFNNNLKRFIIHLSGSTVFSSYLKQHKIAHNASFAGIYCFTKKLAYATRFQGFLAQAEDRGLIMCHPGRLSTRSDDIVKARQLEYDYLKSEEFIADCERANVIIGRFLLQ